MVKGRFLAMESAFFSVLEESMPLNDGSFFLEKQKRIL